jgi:hypothetical protein
MHDVKQRLGGLAGPFRTGGVSRKPVEWFRQGIILGGTVRAIPAVLLLTGAVVLGVLLGIEYLRRVRSKPLVIGLHLLLGAGSLEVMAMLLHGTPDGAATPALKILQATAALMAFALCSGLVAPMIGRRSRSTMNAALGIHVAAAAAGFVLCLYWFVSAAWWAEADRAAVILYPMCALPNRSRIRTGFNIFRF